MKATEFCDFFEFSIKRISYEELPEDEWFDERDTIYEVKDDHSCFRSRYVSRVDTLSECFDSMLEDYIETFIEEDGFEYNERDNKTYYEQALEWCEEQEYYKKSDIKEVIKCLINPSLIENDVEEKKGAIA